MAAGAAVLAARRQAIVTADAAWSAYARARGFHYRPARIGWAHEQLPRVDAMLDGISVALELTDVLATAAIAIPPHPLAGNVHVTWEGPVSKIAKLFGAQDITLGDPDFDPKFMVKATNPDVARNLLTPAIRSQMLAVGVTELAYDDATTHAHVPMAVVFSRRWERPAGLIDESRDGDRVESETWLD